MRGDTVTTAGAGAQLSPIHGVFSARNLVSPYGIVRNAGQGFMLSSMSRTVSAICLCICMLGLQACDIAPYQPVTPQPVVVPNTGAPKIDMHLPSRSSDYTPNVGSEIVIRAISLLGAPYQWGGSGPTAFDCSGLVHFIYTELGIPVPRTAEEQFRAATRVDIDELEPGDLLFFKIRGPKISHVAIYAGSNRFVHAPQTGRPIEFRALNDGYYRPRLAAAGRL
jgi:murein DD-endopeptidase